MLKDDLDPRLDKEHMKGRLGRRYIPSDDLVAAANLALALQRPLLLTGEPGCGKTDFAFAAAASLGHAVGAPTELRTPLQCYVRSETRAKDLLYHHDAIRRYGEAQVPGEDGIGRARDPRWYVELQPLARGLMSTTRRVVLVDEIDKAPRDLPNDLLRELEQGSFEIPEVTEEAERGESVTSHGVEVRRRMERPRGDDGELLPGPLVVITSNVERQLPDAFLRRCIFFHIEFPSASDLGQILEDHFEEHFEEEEDVRDQRILNNAQALFLALRDRERFGLAKRPGTSELIDWVRGLLTVFDRGHVVRQLEVAERALRPKHSPVWKDVPGLSCLVKLREDLETLDRRAARA